MLKTDTAANPLVSVIMPCYNAAPYLVDALNSILHQTYINLEIILINDGSSDATHNILQKFIAIDPRIKLIQHDENIGLIASLNEGIAKATGTFIARMDSDDISRIDRIELQLNHLLSDSDIDIVSSGYFYIKPKLRSTVSIKPKGTLPLTLKFISLLATPIAHACAIGKSTIFKSYIYDSNFIHSEDYDIFSRMAFSGIKLYNMVEPLYGIRLHEQRVSNLYEEEQIQSHIRISEKNVFAYFGLHIPKHIHCILVNRFTGIVRKQDLLTALNVMQNIKRDYLSIESCGQSEKREIEKFVDEQRVDILIQAMKNGLLLNRLILLTLLPTFILLLLKPGIFKYLWIKLRMKL